MKTVNLLLVDEEKEYRGEIEQPVEFVKAENVEGDKYKIASIPMSSQVIGYNWGTLLKRILIRLLSISLFKKC